MKIFKKVFIKYLNVYRIYFLGLPIIDISLFPTHNTLSFYKKPKPYKNQKIFYLKVNRWHITAFHSINYWLELANKMDAFVYFVCDNKDFQYSILYECKFFNKDFIFINSDRVTMKKVVKIFSKGKWQNVANAIFTPFIHSVKNNYLNTWHIDADDMIFLNNQDRIANALYKVEEYANQNDIDAINLDTLTSHWYGIQWAFGLVYVRNPKQSLNKCFENKDYKNNYQMISSYNLAYINSIISNNVDLLFTVLRDTKQLNLKTFYIENAVLIHEPDRLLSEWTSYIIQWHNGNLEFLLNNLLQNINKKIPIFKTCIKFDAKIDTMFKN